MVWSFLHHWLWQDLYVPVWPNIVADPFCALLAVLYGVVKIRQHINLKHNELKDLAVKHHKEALDQAQAHHEDMKKHITTTLKDAQ